VAVVAVALGFYYLHHVDTFDNLSSTALQGCPGTETQASSFMRRLRCIQGQVQQTASHLCPLCSQRFSVHLRCLEEARKARTHTEEEPRWYPFHQSLQATAIPGWQRIWKVQNPP
jgi:hypothetical protein